MDISDRFSLNLIAIPRNILNRFRHRIPKRWIEYIKDWSRFVKIIFFKSFPIFSILAVTFVLLLISTLLAGEWDALLSISAYIFDIFLAVSAVSIWLFGKWSRDKFRSHWKKQTYPFQNEILSEDSDLLEELLALSPIKEPPFQEYTPPEIDSQKVKQITSHQLFFGFLIVVGGVVILPVFGDLINPNIGDISVEMSSTVSTSAGFISVLLSPLIGALTLAIVSVSTRPGDIIILVLIIIFPMSYIIPAARNLIALSRNYYYQVGKEDYIDGSISRQIVFAVIMACNIGVLLLIGRTLISMI